MEETYFLKELVALIKRMGPKIPMSTPAQMTENKPTKGLILKYKQQIPITKLMIAVSSSETYSAVISDIRKALHGCKRYFLYQFFLNYNMGQSTVQCTGTYF